MFSSLLCPGKHSQKQSEGILYLAPVSYGPELAYKLLSNQLHPRARHMVGSLAPQEAWGRTGSIRWTGTLRPAESAGVSGQQCKKTYQRPAGPGERRGHVRKLCSCMLTPNRSLLRHSTFTEESVTDGDGGRFPPCSPAQRCRREFRNMSREPALPSLRQAPNWVYLNAGGGALERNKTTLDLELAPVRLELPGPPLSFESLLCTPTASWSHLRGCSLERARN